MSSLRQQLQQLLGQKPQPKAHQMQLSLEETENTLLGGAGQARR